MIEYKVNESFYDYNDYDEDTFDWNNWNDDDKDVYIDEDDLRCGVCKTM